PIPILVQWPIRRKLKSLPLLLREEKEVKETWILFLLREEKVPQKKPVVFGCLLLTIGYCL
ncbi:MAG: hypothetical protein ABEJ65_07495, partial [bacterium]